MITPDFSNEEQIRLDRWRRKVLWVLEFELSKSVDLSEDRAFTLVAPSGYYEDDTESIELPYTQLELATNFRIEPSGTSLQYPPALAYASESGFASSITYSGSYAFSASGGGPIVTPTPEQIAGQMRESGGCGLYGVSGTLFQPTHSGSAGDKSFCSLDGSGIAIPSQGASSLEWSWSSSVDQSGLFIAAATSTGSDCGSNGQVAIGGTYLVILASGSSSDATSASISFSGNASVSASPSSTEAQWQLLDGTGSYLDGSKQSILPQSFGDTDRMFSGLDASGAYTFASAILDESGAFILDELGEPLMQEA